EIPNTVIDIGFDAFCQCTNLSSITIPNSVTIIKDDAFYKCTNLSSVNIPGSVTKIGAYAFSYCDSIKEIIIPDSVEEMGYFALRACNGLKHATIGKNVKKIEDYTFTECEYLETVIIKNGCETIGPGAFNGCIRLKEIFVPNSVTTIGDNAFYNASDDFTVRAGCLNSVAETKIVDGTNRYLEIIHAEPVVNKDYERPATYDKEGYYEKVVRCPDCGHEFSWEEVITPKLEKTSLEKATVSGIKDKTFTGKNTSQSITVKLGKKTLVKGTDYKVSLKNCANVGTATLTVTGINAYKGTIKKTYKINPKGTEIKKLTAGKKAFTAKWTSRTKQTSGYEIQYATDKKFSKNKKTVKISSNKTAKKTVKSLKAKKKYFVRIRTYKTVSKKKYYSSWSKAKTVTTKK
ncbi:MAG: leucine-rich repeat protein, partial [Eubacterium sp.]|nr:leucine-rich repeat protein [Eubacterium sp.]